MSMPLSPAHACRPFDVRAVWGSTTHGSGDGPTKQDARLLVDTKFARAGAFRLDALSRTFGFRIQVRSGESLVRISDPGHCLAQKTLDDTDLNFDLPRV